MKDLCPQMLFIAVFIIEKSGKKVKHPKVRERLNKLQNQYIMEYYRATEMFLKNIY